MERLTTLLILGQPPKALRGLYNNRPQRKLDDLIIKIREYIESLLVKTSHYALKAVSYLDVRLNVKAIQALFKKISRFDRQNKV